MPSLIYSDLYIPFANEYMFIIKSFSLLWIHDSSNQMQTDVISALVSTTY